MNFGREGVQAKTEQLESKQIMRGKWAGVLSAKILLLVIVAVLVLGISFGIGAYSGILATCPDISDVNIVPVGQASFIYDNEGNQIQKLNLSSGNRVSVSIEEIPLNMQHAIVAIEDARFYEHKGVDPIGMVRALVMAVSTGFSRTEGASTITQQLLKNNVFTDWTQETKFESIKRKIQEQYLAIELEQYLTAQGKDPKAVILGNYLNTVNFGAGSYGVETAAQTYFGKSARDLTLSECAVLAAIPQNPSRFNPRRYPEYNAERREKVLKNMLEQNYITQTEYQEAINDDVYSRIQESGHASDEAAYSYFVDALVDQVQHDLITKKGYTEIQASMAVYSGGLRIYSTEDPRIQQIMTEEFENEENFPNDPVIALDWALSVDHENGERQHYSREMLQKYFRENMDENFDLLFESEDEARYFIQLYKDHVLTETDTVIAERASFTEQPQACMTVIDQKTGHILGIIGGRGRKTASLTLNRASDSTRQPGSTFKILSTYGPALDLGVINLASRVLDEPYNYSDGTPVHNSDGQYRGEISIREAIEQSVNVAAIKTLTTISPRTGYEYLTRMGFTTLVDSTSNGDVIQPLALGGLTNGVTNVELTAAYAAIANKGVYNRPVYYTKVTDSEGNVILSNEPESTRVFSESTAFLLTSAMMDVVSFGTGTSFQLDGMVLAGKTGTTTIYRDMVFAGYTPYYTAAIWAGYDVGAELPPDYRNYQQQLYTRIMNRIHEGLPLKGFEVPSTVKPVKLCAASGLLAGQGCNVVTEFFEAGKEPTVTCTAHKPTPTPTPVPTIYVPPKPGLDHHTPQSHTEEPEEQPGEGAEAGD